MTSSGVPEIEAGWALFLDLDGTLLDIAPTPDSVRVPAGLIETLADLRQRLGGALAIVTGRARDTVDGLLAPLAPAGGFGHGAELRDAGGRVVEIPALPAVPAGWVARLLRQSADWQGVVLERKPHGLALHYRNAPTRREDVFDALVALLAEDDGGFELLPAQMAFEIRPRLANKGRAVEALMDAAPFRGRRPIFVGDDVTDEAGMDAARRQGGLGLRVGRDFPGGPREVRAWIARAALRPPQEPADAQP